MPPLCVVKGKTQRSLQSFATQDGPEGTIWSYQANAWMDDDIGHQWFQQVYLANCGPARPQLLVLDSPHSHEVLDMLEIAQEQEIHVLVLPPHTTHALQPLDKVVFKPFKTAYKRACTEFLASHPTSTINKGTWPRLLKQTWDSTMKESLIMKAFEATGIHPVNRSRIPDSVFQASEAIKRMRPATDPEVSENLQTGGDTGEEAAEGDLGPSAVGIIAAADHNYSAKGESEDEGVVETIQTVSFDDMEQLDFLNGLMIDITDNDIEQAVEASNLSQLVDTLRSPTAIATTTATTPASPFTTAAATATPAATPTAAVATTVATSAACQPDWRAEVDAVFEMRPAPNKEITPRKSKAILTHRLLTSEKLINDKREQLEKKRKEEAAKQERREKALQKKLAKTKK